MSLLFTLAAWAAEPRIEPAELARHAADDDCWIAIEGGVYDVSEFVAAHPGGAVIVDACGTDGSDLFQARPPEGEAHSAAARQILAKYRVGVLDGAAEAAPQKTWRILDPMRARHGVAAPTTTIVGHNQLHFEFAHHFHFPDAPSSNIRTALGWGIANWADIVISHVTWSGEAGGQVRFAMLQEAGRRKIGTLDRGAEAPLGLTAVVSGGYRTADAIPDAERLVFTGQLVVERTFGPATLNLAPGVRQTDELTPFATALLDLKPHYTGGMFAEMAVSPLGNRLQYRFSAGLRIYTRAHVFTVYGGNSPSLGHGEIASPIGGGGFGFAIARRFPFPGG